MILGVSVPDRDDYAVALFDRGRAARQAVSLGVKLQAVDGDVEADETVTTTGDGRHRRCCFLQGVMLHCLRQASRSGLELSWSA